MGSERAFWRTLKKNVEWRALLQRHEDVAETGIPDVSYIDLQTQDMGWVELKQVHEYPKRATTPVRLPHFTDDQRVWLFLRGDAGGNCAVAIQVAKDYFVFGWWDVFKLGELTKEEMIDRAVFYSRGRPNWDELWDAIINCKEKQNE